MKKAIASVLIISLILVFAVCVSVSSAQNSTDINKDSYSIVQITLGDTIKANTSSVYVENNNVYIMKAGYYSISGTLNEGQIVVNTKGTVSIELDDVTVKNSNGPALLVENADVVTITLATGTTNNLSDTHSDSKYDAAIYSNDTLIIDGQGTLVINGNNNEGISSDDDLIINGGNLKISAVDDGLNAHDDITISGGYVYINAQGDGIDSNGTINIGGGTVISLGSNKTGEGGLDAVDKLKITGGTIISTGASFATPCSDSTQYSMFLSFDTIQNAYTVFSIQNEGNEIITFSPNKSYSSIFFSSSKLSLNTAYNLYLDGNSTGTNIDGLYIGGKYSNGILASYGLDKSKFEVSDIFTSFVNITDY